MTKVTMISVMIFLGILLASCSEPPHGSPTPVDGSIAWDTYTDPDGIGFFLYWAPEAESPRQYIDTRKVDLGRPFPEQIVVKDVMPAKASLCFKLTAYDAAGNESDWSGEACGWFGLTAPGGLVVGS